MMFQQYVSCVEKNYAPASSHELRMTLFLTHLHGYHKNQVFVFKFAWVVT